MELAGRGLVGLVVSAVAAVAVTLRAGVIRVNRQLPLE